MLVPNGDAKSQEPLENVHVTNIRIDPPLFVSRGVPGPGSIDRCYPELGLTGSILKWSFLTVVLPGTMSPPTRVIKTIVRDNNLL